MGEDISGSLNVNPRTADTTSSAISVAGKKSKNKSLTGLTMKLSKSRQSHKDATTSAIRVAAGGVDEARYQSTGLQQYSPEPTSTRRAVLEFLDGDETSARWRAAGTCSNSMAVIVQRLQELKRGHPNRITRAVDEDTGAILLIL
jgi:hypothetical protein